MALMARTCHIASDPRQALNPPADVPVMAIPTYRRRDARLHR